MPETCFPLGGYLRRGTETFINRRNFEVNSAQKDKLKHTQNPSTKEKTGTRLTPFIVKTPKNLFQIY